MTQRYYSRRGSMLRRRHDRAHVRPSLLVEHRTFSICLMVLAMTMFSLNPPLSMTARGFTLPASSTFIRGPLHRQKSTQDPPFRTHTSHSVMSIMAHKQRRHQHHNPKARNETSLENSPSSIMLEESRRHCVDLSNASLDEAALEWEAVMLEESQSTVHHEEQLQSELESSNQMDSFPCECQDEEVDDSVDNSGNTKRRHDDLVKHLFVSLVDKVKSYNPEAVEGIDLSQLDNHDDDNSLSSHIENAVINRNVSPGSLLLKAYRFAKSAHEGQCRKSGEPYITHPINVAHIIADLKLDTPSLLTALLHDTVEDTPVTLQNINDAFSPEISHLVDGVTKVGKLPFTSHEEQQSENYRKMILAMSQDIRVVLVKLADRTHNMRTLQYMPPEKQRRIARETMEIYAPLAHRLGIHWLKTELEDECFKYLYPEQYEMLDSQVREKAAERKEYESEVVEVLERQMKEAGLGSHGKTLLVSGRTKGLYSIYSKMKRQHIQLEDVYDKIGFRIVVDDVASCYQALGVIHSHWKPAGTGKIKDYIALPKPNGYKSLHTTIIGPRGKRIEVQIRTVEMHEVAESGIAAHWIYKQKNRGGKNGGAGGGTKEDTAQFTWLRELLAEVRRQNDPIEFIDSVKEDLFAREVFVFSPKGDLYALARGSSVLDFAYLIHSDLGNHCGGAKVNGKMVTLKHLVQNGDTVEILKSNHQTPKREWLRYVRTSKAKNRIRAWLKRRQREKSVFEGKATIDQALKKYSPRGAVEGKKEYQRKLEQILTSLRLSDEKELFAAVGYGRISVESVMRELFGAAAVLGRSGKSIDKREKGDEFVLQAIENQSVMSGQVSPPKPLSKTGIVVGKERNILLTFCKNCTPLYGEHVLGVITKGKGIKVHRQGCEHLLETDERRVVNVMWDADSTHVALRPIQVQVFIEDSPGVFANMCNAISQAGFNIGNVNLRKLSNGRGLARLEVMLRTAEDLERVLSKIKQEEGIISVQRR
eukprot:CCRYP_017645-RA/>CCRYP_017645-RA protein AED:0.05 eAED:0.05 QI:344/1/1/1/0.25/0.2/5/1862/986